MNKKYQIFISSTFADLKDERSKVYNLVHKMRQIPVGMEYFNAASESQWKTIQRIIDVSDYYVLIIGHRYGSISEKDGISYTEKEYNYAQSLGIPVLAFIRNRDASVQGSFVDGGDAKEQLECFIKTVSSDAICDFWSTGDELAMKVGAAIHQAIDDHPQPGWVRWTDDFEKREIELVALSGENRRLRAEIDAIHKSPIILKNYEKPNFSVSFEGSKEHSINVTFDKTKCIKKLERLSEISTDIPEELKSYISPGVIEEYNENLFHLNSKILEYNESIPHYNQRIAGIMHPFTIFNTGQCKATDVLIDLIFPDSFILCSIHDDNIEMPKRPNIPVNPLVAARSKFETESQKHSRAKAMPWDIMLNRSSVVTNISFGKEIGASGILHRMNSPLTCNGNIAIVRFAQIMHTRSRRIDELVICAPFELRNYKATISIICTELSAPQDFEFDVFVE